MHELGDEIAAVAAAMTHNEYKLSQLIGEFDESGAWREFGALSCAHWLSWRIGMSPGAARERVRVANALRALPAVDAAFGAGRLSYSKVRAMTRVASAENEALLVEMAEFSTGAELEKLCRRFRNVVDAEAEVSVEEVEARRTVRARTLPNGWVRVQVELPPDEGARLIAGMDSASEASQRRDERAAGGAEGAAGGGARTAGRSHRADGLMALVENWFAEGPRPRRGGAPNEVILHVSAETPPFIENEDAGAVSDATARRLCCDASVSTVHENARGEVVDVGRKRRTVPPAMRRALEAERGRCCAFPGCTHTLYLDAHHVMHWLNGGETKRDNLVLLCRRHHTFVHEHGWTIEARDGAFEFSSPTVGRVPRRGDADRAELIERAVRRDGPRDVDVWAQAAQGDRWEPVDYGEVVGALVALRLRGDARGVGAGAPAGY